MTFEPDEDEWEEVWCWEVAILAGGGGGPQRVDSREGGGESGSRGEGGRECWAGRKSSEGRRERRRGGEGRGDGESVEGDPTGEPPTGGETALPGEGRDKLYRRLSSQVGAAGRREASGERFVLFDLRIPTSRPFSLPSLRTGEMRWDGMGTSPERCKDLVVTKGGVTIDRVCKQKGKGEKKNVQGWSS